MVKFELNKKKTEKRKKKRIRTKMELTKAKVNFIRFVLNE